MYIQSYDSLTISKQLRSFYANYILELKLRNKPLPFRKDMFLSNNKRIAKFIANPVKHSLPVEFPPEPLRQSQVQTAKEIKEQEKEKSDAKRRSFSTKIIRKAQPPKIIPRRLTLQENTLMPMSKTVSHFKSLAAQQNFSKTIHIKFMQFYQLPQLVALSNYLIVETQTQFKAYICRGNNGQLIRNLLKSRNWWSFTQDIRKANLVWTQWHQPQIANSILNNQNDPKIIYTGKTTKKKFRINQEEERKVFQKRYQKIKKILPQELHTMVSHKVSTDPSSPALTNLNFKMIQDLDLFNLKANSLSLTHNHLDGLEELHCKRLMYYNLLKQCRKQSIQISKIVPQTFIVQPDNYKEQLSKIFIYTQSPKKTVWIVKPGQNSNRGRGIKVTSDFKQIEQFAMERITAGKSAVIQKYLTNCLLINKRKFDIRCFLLITHNGGRTKGYWYKQGYIRTSCKQFSLKNLSNKYIHLTNDAVQKKSKSYGKFQDFNKISFLQYQRKLQEEGQDSNKFIAAVIEMRRIAHLLLKSVVQKVQPRLKTASFELFGLDFMLVSQYKPLLIECNSNPCLQTGGNLLGRLIPQLLQNVMRIGVDPMFPPSERARRKLNGFYLDGIQRNNFQILM